MGINDCKKTEVCLLELRSAFLKWIGSVWGSTWEGRLQWMIISSWHQPPASALLQTSCLLCCGEGNANKRLLWKKSLAIGQLVYSLDSKRLSHEGFISAASQFCREKKISNVKGRQDRKTNTRRTYSTVCSCLWEWFLLASVSEKWDFLSLAFFNAFHVPLNSHSQPLAAAVWDGNLSEGRCCASQKGVLELMGWVVFLPPTGEPHACLECKLWAPFPWKR